MLPVHEMGLEEETSGAARSRTPPDHGSSSLHRLLLGLHWLGFGPRRTDEAVSVWGNRVAAETGDEPCGWGRLDGGGLSGNAAWLVPMLVPQMLMRRRKRTSGMDYWSGIRTKTQINKSV